MTDRFEESVRQAAQGLSGGGAELPTYESAWRRGRRRRFVKRGAMAVAGAAVVAVALTVNLDLPGSEPTDGDVAAPLVVATAEPEPTPLSTTAPVETPTADLSTTPDEATASAAAAGSAPTAAAETPTAVPTVPPDPSPTAQQSIQPTPAPPVEPPSPQATAVPTLPPAQATQTPNPAALETTPPSGTIPTETIPADTIPTDTTTTDTIPTETTPDAAAATGPVPPDEPAVAATTLADGPADAVLLDPVAPGVAARFSEGLPCDLDGDTTADATCEVLPDYPCGVDEVPAPGYEAVDLNGDGAADTCVAAGVTTCDTTGDGVGDTPCTIELGFARPEDPES